MVHTSEVEFDADVLRSDLPVLADFWAEWCGPCRVIAPLVEDISKEYGGRMRFAKVDVEKNPDLAGKYGVQGIPTLIFFKAGQEVKRITGAAPRGRLVQEIDKILAG